MIRDMPERDWKVLRDLKSVALARYCEQALDEVIALASERAGGSHERYLAVFKLINERNDQLSIAFDDLRRSTRMLRLAAMRRLDLFSEEDYNRFSVETREAVQRLLGLE